MINRALSRFSKTTLLRKLSLFGAVFVMFVGVVFSDTCNHSDCKSSHIRNANNSEHLNKTAEMPNRKYHINNDSKFGNLNVFFDPSYVKRTESNSIYGKNVDLLECISVETGFNYSIIDVSWSRGQFLLKSGKLDIMMKASKDDYRNLYATPSIPIETEKFVLVFYPRTHSSLNTGAGTEKLLKSIKDRNYTIASIKGSAESNKLYEYGVTNQTRGFGIEEMVRLIFTGLADAFVSEISIVEEYEKENNIELKKIGVFDIPCVHYVSNRVTSANPDFMEKFNRSIAVCNKKIRK